MAHFHNCFLCGKTAERFGKPESESDCLICKLVKDGRLPPEALEYMLCDPHAEEERRSRPNAESVIREIEKITEEMRQFREDLTKPSN